jgi:hypothetical protein
LERLAAQTTELQRKALSKQLWLPRRRSKAS